MMMVMLMQVQSLRICGGNFNPCPKILSQPHPPPPASPLPPWIFDENQPLATSSDASSLSLGPEQNNRNLHQDYK